MKAVLIFGISLFLLSLSSFDLMSQEKYASNTEIVDLEEKLAKDNDFISLLQLEELSRRNVLNGNFDKIKDELLEFFKNEKPFSYRVPICDKVTQLKEENKHSPELINYYENKCSKRILLEKVKEKYPEFYELPIEDAVEIKERIADKLNLQRIDAGEALELYLQRKDR